MWPFRRKQQVVKPQYLSRQSAAVTRMLTSAEFPDIQATVMEKWGREPAFRELARYNDASHFIVILAKVGIIFGRMEMEGPEAIRFSYQWADYDPRSNPKFEVAKEALTFMIATNEAEQEHRYVELLDDEFRPWYYAPTHVLKDKQYPADGG